MGIRVLTANAAGKNRTTFNEYNITLIEQITYLTNKLVPNLRNAQFFFHTYQTLGFMREIEILVFSVSNTVTVTRKLGDRAYRRLPRDPMTTIK
jgi:hypothetical protein